KLASALQHRASAWIARLQAAGAGGLHPGIRAGGPATPTSDAARAGATTIIALTIKLDPSVGADHFQFLSGCNTVNACIRPFTICTPAVQQGSHDPISVPIHRVNTASAKSAIAVAVATGSSSETQ